MAKRYTEADVARLRNKMGENVPVPKERKKPTNEESRIQQSVLKWWAIACAGYGVPEFMLFSIPNGGKRDVLTATIMKREGARRGVSDLFLAVPTHHYHGLFIEMKRPGGVVAAEQKQFMGEAMKRQYLTSVCYIPEEAQALIHKYLSGEFFGL